MANRDISTLVVSSGLVLVAALAILSGSGYEAWSIALAVVLIGLTKLIRVPTASGGQLYLGTATAAAVPIFMPEIEAIILSFVGGMMIATGIRLATDGADEAAKLLVPESTALAAYATAFMAAFTMFERAEITGDFAVLTALIGGALAWLVAGSITRSLMGEAKSRLAPRYLWLVALADWPVVLSLFATGALLAFAYPVMGAWAVPVAVLPYAFSHVSFVRYNGTRTTYGQTIRALARIPEVAGLAPEGHAARTADIATAVARDMGLGPQAVGELEHAALLHDIGRITLNEPAILKAGYTDEDIARWGSQIVAEAPFLHRVAEIVRQQHHPFRRPGEEINEGLPLASKIIKVASAYDQAVSDTLLPPHRGDRGAASWRGVRLRPARGQRPS